ncbi:MAG: tetratricopeptide repeat protein [Paracoccaceae bacterium]
MLKVLGAILLVVSLGLPVQTLAQAQTVEDVRKDIISLSTLMQELRAELLSTGNSGVSQDSIGPILQRLNNLEAELRAAMGQIETLQFRINQIAEDGTRRVGDLEFRLTEIEGGDTSAQGITPPLGGADNAGNGSAGLELASDEQRSFDKGVTAYDSGEYQAAAEMFGVFTATYPGGPLTSEAQFRHGQSLAGLQDWGGAARLYLDSFSGAPDGPLAADALFELSVSLGALEQGEQACLTLNEIGTRYPDRMADMGAKIAAQRQAMSCP